MKRQKHQSSEQFPEPKYGKVYKNSDKSPEKRLFEAVLLTFLFDAQKDYNEYLMMTNGMVKRQRIKLSNHRITAWSNHVEMICDLVGMHHGSYAKKIDNITRGIEQVEVKSLHF